MFFNDVRSHAVLNPLLCQKRDFFLVKNKKVHISRECSGIFCYSKKWVEKNQQRKQFVDKTKMQSHWSTKMETRTKKLKFELKYIWTDRYYRRFAEQLNGSIDASTIVFAKFCSAMKYTNNYFFCATKDAPKNVYFYQLISSLIKNNVLWKINDAIAIDRI